MRTAVALAALALAVAGCNQERAETVPPPQALTADAMAQYCGMDVLEHPGPKGQIILTSRLDPVWFASARDAIAFTMLPDEPKDIRAVYVSDMGRAPSWDRPGADNWVEARRAWFVIGSAAHGGMGADEAVPFAERAAAERFAAEEGGRVMAWAEVPRDFILGDGGGARRGSDAPSPSGREGG
jgi:copper chaperone NosL